MYTLSKKERTYTKRHTHERVCLLNIFESAGAITKLEMYCNIATLRSALLGFKSQKYINY